MTCGCTKTCDELAKCPAPEPDNGLEWPEHAMQLVGYWKEANTLKAENKRLREALQRAVDLYGKPGGPWNVPGDPGGWLEQARQALASTGDANNQQRPAVAEE